MDDDLGISAASTTRRGSYAQPGVATRHARATLVTHRKSLPAPIAEPQVWKKDMMVASPLARLTGFEGLEAPPTFVENRAHTPTDQEYGHLGNMKHGSLMITNGPPSPVPSIATNGRTSRRCSDEREEDFFTASENGSAFGDNENYASPSRQSARDSVQSVQEDVDAMLREPQPQTPEHAQPSKGVPFKRDGSPLKREVRVESLEDQNNEDLGSRHAQRLAQTRSILSFESRTETRYSFDNSSLEEGSKIRHEPDASGSTTSLVLANDYMAELPPSPFKKTRSLESPTQSHADEGFSECDIRESIIERPFSMVAGHGQISPRKPLNSHPPGDMIPTRMVIQPRGSKLAKSDSGYSSSASNSIVVSPAHAHRPVLATVESVMGASFADRFPPLPTTSTVDVFTVSTASAPDATIMESIEEDFPRREKPKRSKSWKKSVRKSLPRLLSSDPAFSNDSNLSLGSSASKSDKQPKKLQKRRPLSTPPISIGDAHHGLDKGVPRVPSTVFSRYSGRLSASPSMQFLERTHENANDLNRGSASPRPATTGSLTIPETYFPDSDKPPPPPSHRFSFARRGLRRSRTQVEEGDDVIGVADFGTVAESLGSSPYDIAMTGPRAPISGVPTLPHHMSTNAPRSGPREGWDAETASRIAIERSRARAAENQARYEQSATPHKGDRPVSYHEGMSSQNHRAPDAPTPRSRLSYHEDMPHHGYQPQDIPMPPRSRSSHQEAAPHHAHRVNNSPAPRPRSAYQEETPNHAYQSEQAPRSRPRLAHQDGAYNRAFQPQDAPMPRPQSSYQEAPPTHAYQQQHVPHPRPQFMHTRSTPAVPRHSYQQPPSDALPEHPQAPPHRAPSPVKSLVDVFNQRASAAPSLPPMPSSPQPDWTNMSSSWRDRRIAAAQTIVNTTTSTTGTSKPSISTSITCPVSTTTSMAPPTNTTTSTSRVGNTTTFTYRNGNTITTTTVTTSTTAGAQRPAIQNRKSMPQIRQRSSREMLTAAQRGEPFFNEDGVFGRYGGGSRHPNERFAPGERRDVTPSTRAAKQNYGVDFGDVPFRVI